MDLRAGVVVIAAVVATAQPPEPVARYGIFGGYGANLYTAQFQRLPGVPNCCPGFSGGRGTGLTLGLIGEYPWLPYAWISGRLGYASLSGELWEQERIGNVALIGAAGDTLVRAAEVGHALQTSLSVVMADVGLSSRFFGRFSARIGVTLGVLLTRRFSQYEQLLAPEGFVFAREGSRRRNQYTGTIPDAPLALLGTSFGIGYALPLGRAWEVIPTFHYTFFLTDLSSVSWKASTLRLGLAVLHSLFPPPAPVYDTVYRRDTTTIAVLGVQREELVLSHRRIRIDTLPLDGRLLYRTTIEEVWQRRVPRISRLEPRVQLTLPGSESTLLIEELEQEEAFPVLPYIFFPEGSADLRRTRMQLLTPAQVEQFIPEKLPWNTLQIYSHLLNIVGERLRRFPEAELTVTGCVSNVGVEAANRDLAQRRAEAVREYLQRVWQIEPRRLRVQARLLPAIPSNPETPDGREENQRVELSASLPDVLAPLFLAEVGYTASSDVVLIHTAVEAETTVVAWEIRAYHGEQQLFLQRGTGMPPAEIPMSVEAAALARGDTLIWVELWVVDATGAEKRVRSYLPFQRLSLRQKKAERAGNERRERFALLLFEYDKATLTQEHRRLLSLIRQRIMPNTRVRISGYTDRTGDPAYNKRLAEQRCRNVQQALGLRTPVVEIRAIGSDTLLYPNDLPEGRAYSRTVVVELLTPVE